MAARRPVVHLKRDLPAAWIAHDQPVDWGTDFSRPDSPYLIAATAVCPR